MPLHVGAVWGVMGSSTERLLHAAPGKVSGTELPENHPSTTQAPPEQGHRSFLTPPNHSRGHGFILISYNAYLRHL